MEHRTSRQRRPWSSLGCLLLLSSCALAGSTGCERETFSKPRGPGSWVLVDLFHSRKQNPLDYGLGPGVYAYQGVHGYRRLFQHLGRNGYPWTALKKSRIDADHLQGFSVVFINLLSEARPDFDASEIKAITQFVAQGGGLVVIADHTNVYRHAERLNPLLVPMGIEVMPHTAVDGAGHTVSGNGWLALRNLAKHPSNDGVDMISMQTGGVLKSACGTAFLSEEHGYADYWNEEDTEGFYGNWKHDGDEELEPKGALPVVAACSFKKGRVAVVGDQNIYGDAWIQYGDNFRHASNVFEWAAKRETDSPRLRDKPQPGLHFSVDTQMSRHNVGTANLASYYGFFVHANRRLDMRLWAASGPGRRRQVHLMPPAPKVPAAEDLEALKRWVQAGGRLTVFLDVSRAPRGSVALLQKLAPELTWKTVNTEFGLDGGTHEVARAWQRVRIERYTEAKRLRSSVPSSERCPAQPFVNDRRFKVAGLQSGQEKKVKRYLLKLKSGWGEPLFDADNATIARRKRLGRGELVVFLQDSFFWGRSLGKTETSRPAPGAEGAQVFLDHLLDYLATPLDCLY